MVGIPLSVFIIAKNEADRISHTISSVIGWVDEVHVIDSGSTDNTLEISRNLGANAMFRAWEGYGPQKNYGESLCRNFWLLNLDADEEVSPDLRTQIEALFANGQEPAFKAYRLTRKLMHFIEKSGVFGMIDYPVRLYHKDYFGFKSSTVHDSVDWKGKPQSIGTLSGALWHRCFRSYKHMIDKINFYSDLQADDLFAKNRCPSAVRIVFEPVFSFIKAYCIRGYATRGLTGYLEAVIYAFSRTLRLAKTRALFIENAKKNAP